MSRTRTKGDGQLPARWGSKRKTTPMKKQPRRKTTTMKKKCKKVKVTKQLSRAEVAMVADVDATQLLCDVCTSV